MRGVATRAVLAPRRREAGGQRRCCMDGAMGKVAVLPARAQTKVSQANRKKLAKAAAAALYLIVLLTALNPPRTGNTLDRLRERFALLQNEE